MTRQTLQPPTTEPRQDPPLLLLLPGYLFSATKFLVFPRAPRPGECFSREEKGLRARLWRDWVGRIVGPLAAFVFVLKNKLQ